MALPLNLTPYKSPGTAGTTTNPGVVPVYQPTATGTPSTVPIGQAPLPTSLPSLGQTAKAPTPAPTSNTLSSGMANPIDTTYQLKPGESIADYTNRINQYNASKGTQGTGGITNTTTNNAQTGGAIVNNPQPQTTQTQPQVNPNANPYTAQAPTYPGLIGSLATTAQQPSPAFTQAQQQAQEALNALTQSRQQQAEQLSLNYQNPIPLEFQQGRGQILQNQYLAQQNALAQQYAGATAQMGAATGQQAIQQQGLGAAAGLAQPQPYGITNIPYNPVTGQFGGIAGTQATGGGGLQGIGAISGQIGVGQTVTQLNANLGGAQVVGQNLQNLITKNNINPSDITFLNALNQYLQTGVLSNPQYQEFAGQVNELINSLAPILGANGSATDMKTQMASQIINARASGKSMNDVIQYFLEQAKQKIQGYSAGGGVVPGQNSGLTFSSNFFSGQ